jgi:hypothetical protein
MSTIKFYDHPVRPSAFSTLEKVASAIPKKNKSDVRALLDQQFAYTLHRPVRNQFFRNPYTVTNVIDVWECDVLDVQFLAKYIDMH